MEKGIILTVIVPLAMFLMMLGLGTTLTTRALKFALSQRRVLGLGLVAQILIVPACAAVIVTLVDMPDAFKLGIMLLACCPGGTSSNLFCHLGKGNLALSIALTTFSSLLVLITMPIVLQISATAIFGKSLGIDIPQLEILKRLFAMTLVPISLGIALTHYFPKAGEVIAKYTGPFGLLFLMSLTGVIVVNEWDKLLTYLPILGVSIVTLSAAILLVVKIVLAVSPVSSQDKFTIYVEASIQSSALSMFIALTVLENGSQIAIPSGMYSLSMYIVGFSLVYLHRKQKQKDQVVNAQFKAL